MQKQITDHDKKLIVFLIVFVIIVGLGYWGVFPIIRQISETDARTYDAQEERFESDLKVAELPMIKAENDELEKKIADEKKTYFQVMTSDQVDKYMTGMMLSYNLYSYDLDIVMPTEEARKEPYRYSARAAEIEALSEEGQADDSDDETDGEDDDEDAPEADAEDPETGIYAVTVSMRVGGKEENIEKMIDDLSATDKKMHMISYEWDSERSISYNDDGTYEVNSDRILDMEAVIYMCAE